MIALLTFWYCYDDTLARLTETPGLGHVPFWMWCWLWIVCSIANAGSTAASRG